MAEEPENIMLVYLRRIDTKMDALHDEVRDLKLRVGAVEGHMAVMQAEIVGLNRRMDRFDERMTRVERRLDLVEA